MKIAPIAIPIICDDDIAGLSSFGNALPPCSPLLEAKVVVTSSGIVVVLSVITPGPCSEVGLGALVLSGSPK